MLTLSPGSKNANVGRPFWLIPAPFKQRESGVGKPAFDRERNRLPSGRVSPKNFLLICMQGQGDPAAIGNACIGIRSPEEDNQLAVPDGRAFYSRGNEGLIGFLTIPIDLFYRFTLPRRDFIFRRLRIADFEGPIPLLRIAKEALLPKALSCSYVGVIFDLVWDF